MLDGSSPLARGTPPRPGVRAERRRFIPARAGNTAPRPRRHHEAAVHPRSRGEHLDDVPAGAGRIGSSPLARGTPLMGSIEPPMYPVHPRSRGEHGSFRAPGRGQAGSSPLARGTPAGAGRSILSRRFIPARAGNTSPARTWGRSRSVHPRSRGEHAPAAPAAAPANGSSPLARGTLPAPGGGGRGPRFIPARAGNTRPGPRPGPRPSVHPRSRGEHGPGHHDPRTCRGSSPLARGTPRPRAPGRARPRFIPARAGNTAAPLAAPGGAAVHPRSRGEHARAR